MKCQKDLSKKLKNIHNYEQWNDNKLTSTTEPKRKPKLSKQLEPEQNQRNGLHMEGFQRGGGGEE